MMNNKLGKEHKKNILLFQPHSPQIGGVDSVLLQLTELANKWDNNYMFFIALPPNNPCIETYKKQGVNVFEVDNLGFFSKSEPFRNVIRTIFGLSKSYTLLKRVVQDNNIHLIHSHKINSFIGDFVAKRSGIASVHTYHEVNTGNLWIYKIFNFLIESLTDKIIILSDATGELVSTNWRKNPKVQKIYNGINLNHFSPSSCQSKATLGKLGLPMGAPVILAISRIQDTKGIEYYIDAAHEVLKLKPHVQFLMVGDVASASPKFVNYKNSLIQKVNEKGISSNFHFTGIRRDVKNIYSIADVFILSSVFDVFPTTVLEAMAMEIPVVATRVGGVPEQVIDRETGFLVPPANSNLLAKRINELLEDPELSKELGRAGRRRVKDNFSQNIYIEKTLSVYDQVLNRRNAPN